MNTPETTSQSRQAAVYGLAIVGFVALIALGMWLAILSARYVPTVVDGAGGAIAYVGALFASSPKANLTTVPTASTTMPFGQASSTSAVTSTPATSTPSTQATHPVEPTAGTRSATTTALGHSKPALYGEPDLTVTIDAVGYLTSTSTTSFVAATTVPQGDIPAVKFTVKNVGTNVAQPWRFSASIPTATNYLYESVPQQSLNPGDYIDYTLGFSQPIAGANKTITITANFDHAIQESNTSNDTATAQVTILGS